jgi:hypothetical protein
MCGWRLLLASKGVGFDFVSIVVDGEKVASVWSVGRRPTGERRLSWTGEGFGSVWAQTWRSNVLGSCVLGLWFC